MLDENSGDLIVATKQLRQGCRCLVAAKFRLRIGLGQRSNSWTTAMISDLIRNPGSVGDLRYHNEYVSQAPTQSESTARPGILRIRCSTAPQPFGATMTGLLNGSTVA